MRWVKPTIAGILCTLELTACGKLASPDASQDYYAPPQPTPTTQELSFAPAYDCGGTLSSEQRMYLELVYKMQKQGQYYAVLAHVDELEKQAESPQSFYLRAEALRHLGQRDEAEKYYQLLLGGCMTGYGLHGLGLLATESNRLPEAETFLKHACRERPVDAHVHNDYGMVLLLRGRYAAAHKEFMTSLQLDRENRLPLENLVVLLLAQNQPYQAQQLATEYGLKDEDFTRLSVRALQLNSRSSISAHTQNHDTPQTDISIEEHSEAENTDHSSSEPATLTSEATDRIEDTQLSDNDAPPEAEAPQAHIVYDATQDPDQTATDELSPSVTENQPTEAMSQASSEETPVMNNAQPYDETPSDDAQIAAPIQTEDNPPAEDEAYATEEAQPDEADQDKQVTQTSEQAPENDNLSVPPKSYIVETTESNDNAPSGDETEVIDYTELTENPPPNAKIYQIENSETDGQTEINDVLATEQASNVDESPIANDVYIDEPLQDDDGSRAKTADQGSEQAQATDDKKDTNDITVNQSPRD